MALGILLDQVVVVFKVQEVYTQFGALLLIVLVLDHFFFPDFEDFDVDFEESIADFEGNSLAFLFIGQYIVLLSSV